MNLPGHFNKKRVPLVEKSSGEHESIVRVSPGAFEFLFLLQPAGIGSEVRRYFLCSSFFSFSCISSSFLPFFFNCSFSLVSLPLLTLLRLLVGPFEVMLI